VKRSLAADAATLAADAASPCVTQLKIS
jgi:hypothetical protein